jgi:hypothetical protein
VRDKSVVGAEISGPALPRFTSGVAAALEVGESRTLCEQHHDGIVISLNLCRAICNCRRAEHEHFISALKCPSRLHNCYLGSRASSPPQHEGATSYTCHTRPPGSAVLHPPSCVGV